MYTPPTGDIDPFDALRRSQLLAGFTDVGVRILAGAVARRSAGRGTYIFRSGEPSTGLLFIARGKVLLVAREGGAPLGELSEGETLAGFSLLGAGDHLVSALAVNDVELLELSIVAFRQVSREKPQAGAKLVMALASDLADRLRDARGPLREFLLWQVGRRQSEGPSR